MAIIKTPLLSSTRLPMDHFLSGAIIGGMGAAAASFKLQSEGKSDTKQSVKRIANFSIAGGIASVTAISASNAVARKEYIGALAKIALGLGGLVLVESLLNTKEENE